MEHLIATGAVDIVFESELDGWQPVFETSSGGEGVCFVTVRLSRPAAAVRPRFSLKWRFPAVDVQARWTPLSNRAKQLPPNWASREDAQLALGAPVMALFNQAGMNRLTFAFSDALNPSELFCGIREEEAVLDCRIDCFTTPAAPAERYECTLRIDLRPLRYEETLRAVADWWAAMPAYRPSPVPSAAREVVYSSWYSYHQDLFAPELEEECRLARDYGMRSIIVDDGWQTADNNRGYAYCGDWEICPKRFPDMAAHVREVHRTGLKYILWYSMPWVGIHSRAYEMFRGKFLFLDRGMGAAAFDPRFPEVREYLIRTYERALREWDLDGFKLDFIDSFRFSPPGEDPAVAEEYAGRDFKSLPEAVDRLLSDVMARLRSIKPEIMIEFRQNYVGPAMRKYGNMFRAADCPADALTNRVRTIDVRLLAGNTAVHADMLMWNHEEPVEAAALQLLNVFFSVPQISVRLGEIPADHRAMLKFYLGVWREYRDVLLDGTLRAESPELLYPLVGAKSDRRQFVVVFAPGRVADLVAKPGDEAVVVNAAMTDTICLNLPLPAEMVCFDVVGTQLETGSLGSGVCRIAVPKSGILKLRF